MPSCLCTFHALAMGLTCISAVTETMMIAAKVDRGMWYKSWVKKRRRRITTSPGDDRCKAGLAASAQGDG